MQPNFWQRNGLALVSLFVALASLSYNTWRNETSEVHRNVRQAAFRSLEELGELQVIVNSRVYQGDKMHGDYVNGWGRVSLIHDLCDLLPPPSPAAGEALENVWQENFEAWASGADEKAEDRIDVAIADTRTAVLSNLRALR